MEFLSIGSVIRLQQGKQDLMVTSLVPLYNDNGVIGYFDYSGCPFPQGDNGSESYFFNQANIEEVIFKGYEDEDIRDFKQQVMNKISTTKYPHMKIDNSEGNE
ncbi:hypothetical protein LROSRS0_0952 [Furfurilactobacillus rossiae]|nr:hypothetical protein LROSRS0_0952 [Furfurilactobacillus rossiae]